MSRTAGTYTPPASSWNPAVNLANATFADWNALLTDISNALTQSMSLDGQSTPTANLPMGGYRLTGLGAASALTDAATLGDVQSGASTYLTTVAGANTITAVVANLTAYAAGQTFRFIAAAKNTGAVTLNVNSLGAKAVTKFGSTALVDGDIPSGAVVSVVYDGTRFQLVGVATQGSLGTSGWVKLPNGFIKQWGVTNSTNLGDVSVNLPVTFPTAFTGAQAICVNGAGSTATIMSIGAVSTSTVEVGAWNTSAARIIVSFYWTAIGY